MSLKAKFFIIVGVVLITALGLTYTASRLIFMRGLEEIEEVNTSKQVEQALGALSYLISNLEADTADWAAWDDTYAFIEDGNEEYIKSNLGDETLVVLKLDMMLFINSSGDVVFSKAIDLEAEEEVQIPHDLLTYLSDDSPILSRPGTLSYISGIISLKQGPILFASQPILTSEDEGPARGTLVFARYLNAETINELTQVTLFPITVNSLNNLEYPDFAEALAVITKDKPIFVKPLDEQRIGGYTLLKDYFGRPAFILRVEVPRDTYQLGQSVTGYYILSVLGVGVLVIAITWLFIQARVLSRINRLTQGINHIAETGDTSTRIQMKGGDEVSLVAGMINGMLGALEEAGSEIRNSERRYRLLAENVTDVIWTMDNNLKLTYVSPSVINLMGYTAEEAVALTLEESMDTATLEAAKKAFSEEATNINLPQSERHAPSTYEIQLKRKDGSMVWTEIRMSAMHNPDGEAIGFVGIARDITERKQAADELQLRYEQEKALRQQLEEEISKRIEFTRALVHELKTPITPVLAATELLLDEVKNEHSIRLVSSIDRSASNLNRRIDELLDLAKGETDMIRLNLEEINMATMLQDIANEMIPVAISNRQTMTFDIPSSLPTIVADRERVQQIVMNLLNNASKFTPEEGEITLTAKGEENNIVVEIKDTGRGISKEDQKRLFEPYFRRVDDRERLSGLGLGLALSKRFVELHGGQIWVKSRKGRGSTFGFSLPITATSGDEEHPVLEGES